MAVREVLGRGRQRHGRDLAGHARTSGQRQRAWSYGRKCPDTRQLCRTGIRRNCFA